MDGKHALATAIAVTLTLGTSTGTPQPTNHEHTLIGPGIVAFPEDEIQIPVSAHSALLATKSTATGIKGAHSRRSQVTRQDPAAADYPSQITLPEAVVFAQDPDQLDQAKWAIQRFHLAGLELPAELEIWFHGDDGNNPGCGGHRGLRTSRSDLQVVSVCSPVRFTLLHELAHAWAAVTLTESTRDAFVQMRAGADSWANSNHEWAQRATEHLADIMAWGLLEQPVRPSRTLPNDDQSLTEAFNFLTGIDPIHHTALQDGTPQVAAPSVFAVTVSVDSPAPGLIVTRATPAGTVGGSTGQSNPQ